MVTAEPSAADAVEASITVGPEGTCACTVSAGDMHLVKQGEPAAPWSADVIARAHDECPSRVAESELAARQAWRDRRLMALAAHLQRARTEIGS